MPYRRIPCTFPRTLDKTSITFLHGFVLAFYSSNHVGIASAPIHLFFEFYAQFLGVLAVLFPHLLGLPLLMTQLLPQLVILLLQLHVLLK